MTPDESIPNGEFHSPTPLEDYSILLNPSLEAKEACAKLVSEFELAIELQGGTLLWTGEIQRKEYGIGSAIMLPFVIDWSAGNGSCLRVGVYLLEEMTPLLSQLDDLFNPVQALKAAKLVQASPAITRETIACCVAIAGYEFDAGEMDPEALDETKKAIGSERVSHILMEPLPELEELIKKAEVNNVFLDYSGLIEALDDKLVPESPEILRRCTEVIETEFIQSDLSEPFRLALGILKFRNSIIAPDSGREMHVEIEISEELSQQLGQLEGDEEFGTMNLEAAFELASAFIDAVEPLIEEKLPEVASGLTTIEEIWTSLGENAALLAANRIGVDDKEIDEKVGEQFTSIGNIFSGLREILNKLQEIPHDAQLTVSKRFILSHELLFDTAVGLESLQYSLGSLAITINDKTECAEHAEIYALSGLVKSLLKDLNLAVYSDMRKMFTLGVYEFSLAPQESL